MRPRSVTLPQWSPSLSDLGILGAAFGLPDEPVAPAAAQALLASYYGRRGTVRRLSGEKDSNFLVRDLGDGQEFLLKLAHRGEPPEVANMQTAALLHVAERDPHAPVPRVVPTARGEAECAVSIGGGPPRIARLTTFIPGVLQRHAPAGAAQSAAVGAALARLQLALADFRHPAEDRELAWDLKRTAGLRPLLAGIADPDRRARLDRCLDAFADNVAPRLASLPAQVVHNDLNTDNVVVAEDDPVTVRGLIDFGDLVRTPVAVDVAVAAAYQMVSGPVPFAGALDLVAGFHRVKPLLDLEIELLPDLILARLVMRIVISEWRAALFPDNAAYLLRNVPLAWTLLDEIGEGRAAAAVPAFHRACRPERAP